MCKFDLKKADHYNEGLQMLRAIHGLLVEVKDLWAVRGEDLYALLTTVLERFEQGKPDNY